VLATWHLDYLKFQKVISVLKQNKIEGIELVRKLSTTAKMTAKTLWLLSAAAFLVVSLCQVRAIHSTGREIFYDKNRNSAADSIVSHVIH
jgi:hypothetical protein